MLSLGKIRKLISGKAKLPLLFIITFLAGFLIRGGCGEDGPSVPESSHEHSESNEAAVEEWTCSMHPQIRQPEPGQCPICGMDLIPVTSETSGDFELGPRQIELSERARALAEIRVAPVLRQDVEREIRLFGEVTYDERRVKTVTARFPGRIDTLYADYTGMYIQRGAPLAALYSPDIYSAQEELLQAIHFAESTADSSEESSEFSGMTVEAARNKLRLLGLSDDQIQRIEENEAPTEHITIHSTISGEVINKQAIEGSYVTTGEQLLTIADLSRLWVLLDVYESDLAWIKRGQEVEFEAKAYPGEVFTGTVAFIDPHFDSRTRTVSVRLTVANPNRRLKPDMFVTAHIKTDAQSNGRTRKPLTIPASAPLITGERAVVYVELPGKQGIYEGRNVVLGHRAGDRYIVKDGLEEGELVVVNGNFKIDSAIQILAGQSMMNPEGGATSTGHSGHTDMQGREGATAESDSVLERYEITDEFLQQLDEVYLASYDIHFGLSRDSLAYAQNGAEKILAALDDTDMSLLDDAAHMAWMDELRILKESANEILDSRELEPARLAYRDMSRSLIRVVRQFGVSEDIPMYRLHCPMAFDDAGEDWLQPYREVENPWYGASMYKCGSLVEIISEVEE